MAERPSWRGVSDSKTGGPGRVLRGSYSTIWPPVGRRARGDRAGAGRPGRGGAAHALKAVPLFAPPPPGMATGGGRLPLLSPRAALFFSLSLSGGYGLPFPFLPPIIPPSDGFPLRGGLRRSRSLKLHYVVFDTISCGAAFDPRGLGRGRVGAWKSPPAWGRGARGGAGGQRVENSSRSADWFAAAYMIRSV